jgi:opacity protein-like surface antigen
MRSKQHVREEHVMKKLAIIGMVLAGLMLSSASAWAQPTGPTKAEYRALMLRSDGLNQKYELGQYATGLTKAEYRALMLRSEGMNQKYGAYRYSKPPLVSDQLGEIGAWAVPSTQQKNTTPLVSDQLGEIGAWAVPSTQQKNTTPLVSEKLAGLDLQPAATSTSGGGFDWNDAGIGAALAFGFVVLGVGSLLTVRSQQHKPIPH